MKRGYWIVIILIIALFGIWFLSNKISENGIDNVKDCDELGSYFIDFKKSVEKNNYCKVNDDCVVRRTFCSGDCEYFVNKAAVDEIQKFHKKLADKHLELNCQDCKGECRPLSQPKCENNKCVVGLLGLFEDEVR